MFQEPKSGMHAKLENMAKVSYRAELKAVLDDEYQKAEDSLDTPLKRFVLISFSNFLQHLP